VNLDTEEKVKQVNEVIKQVGLGCKPLYVRKHSGDARKDTNLETYGADLVLSYRTENFVPQYP
jgi:hypothetical protein